MSIRFIRSMYIIREGCKGNCTCREEEVTLQQACAVEADMCVREVTRSKTIFGRLASRPLYLEEFHLNITCSINYFDYLRATENRHEQRNILVSGTYSPFLLRWRSIYRFHYCIQHISFSGYFEVHFLTSTRCDHSCWNRRRRMVLNCAVPVPLVRVVALGLMRWRGLRHLDHEAELISSREATVDCGC
jgi:hypothetical protein